MPQGRIATGSVRYEGGRWKARLTIDGRERLVPLEPPMTNPADRAKAIAEAHEIAKLVVGARDARSTSTELVEDWYDRWLAARKEKGKRSTSPRSHLTTHILPVLGGKPMAAVTRDDLEQIVQRLDAKVSRGEIRWKSALNIWGTVTKAFDDACGFRKLWSSNSGNSDTPGGLVMGPNELVVGDVLRSQGGAVQAEEATSFEDAVDDRLGEILVV